MWASNHFYLQGQGPIGRQNKKNKKQTNRKSSITDWRNVGALNVFFSERKMRIINFYNHTMWHEPDPSTQVYSDLLQHCYLTLIFVFLSWEGPRGSYHHGDCVSSENQANMIFPFSFLLPLRFFYFPGHGHWWSQSKRLTATSTNPLADLWFVHIYSFTLHETQHQYVLSQQAQWQQHYC